jgi:dimethylglycine dehydrogenase
MGDSWGLETPLWFAPQGVEPKDIVSFHRSNDFEHVKREVKGVREGVGVTEIANFAKYAITGSGAEAFLSRLMTNRMPKAGRIVLTPMLNERGKLIGDFTIAKVDPDKNGEDRFFMWGSSQAQIYHMRWFERHLPEDGSVMIRPLGMELVGLSIAGPKSRELLARLTDEDVSGAAFRFLDFRETHLVGVPVMINRVTYTGDLGYEIWVKPEYERRLYQKIMEAGEELGIVNFGMRALLSMRLEKNWPTWYRELRPIYGPFEADVGRFVDLKKNDFIGREAAAQEKQDGGKLRRVTFVVDADDADVLGDEPIWHEGKVVGWVTSGGYAHYVDRSLAQGYVPRELALNGPGSGDGGFEIEILGERRPARLQPEPLFDPEGARMRG